MLIILFFKDRVNKQVCIEVLLYPQHCESHRTHHSEQDTKIFPSELSEFLRMMAANAVTAFTMCSKRHHSKCILSACFILGESYYYPQFIDQETEAQRHTTNKYHWQDLNLTLNNLVLVRTIEGGIKVLWDLLLI